MALVGSASGSIAQAELVFQNPAQAAQSQQRLDDRENTRKVMGASEQMATAAEVGDTVSALDPQVTELPVPPAAVRPATQAVAVAPVQPQALAPQAAPAAVTLAQAQAQAPLQVQTPSADSLETPEVQAFTKAELMRRMRFRAEMKNDDFVQQRLEELRLRDEQRRADQLINGGPARLDADSAPVATQAPLPPLAIETVQAPITERPGQPQAAPVAPPVQTPVAVVQVSSGASSPAVSGSSVLESEGFAPREEKLVIRLTPRAGVSSMRSPDANVLVRGRYSAGLSLGIEASESMTFELGYQFSEYGISLQPTYGFSWNSPTGTYESRALRQNLVDAGLKFYLLGSRSRLRPFVGGGGGWQRSFVNYDSRYRALVQAYSPTVGVQDYEASSFVGQINTGMDVRISKSVSVGAQFRYNRVLGSNSSQQIPYNAMWGASGAYSGYGYGGAAAIADPGNQIAGLQLQRASFYSVLAGVNFIF